MTAHQRQYLMKLSSFGILHLTLTAQNLMSKQISWSQHPNQYHRRLPLNKLTGENKNLSGRPRAKCAKVTEMPENPVSIFHASIPRRQAATIVHQIFEISTSAPDLVPRKSSRKRFSPTPRRNRNHQRISLDHLTGGDRQTIVWILNKKQKRHQNVRNFA